MAKLDKLMQDSAENYCKYVTFTIVYYLQIFKYLKIGKAVFEFV